VSTIHVVRQFELQFLRAAIGRHLEIQLVYGLHSSS
jgi:hypothetical protein